MPPAPPSGPRPGRRGRAGPDVGVPRRRAPRRLLIALLTAAVTTAAVCFSLAALSLRSRGQAHGQDAASTQLASPTPTPRFIGQPALSSAVPVPASAPSATRQPGAGPLVPAGVPGRWKLIFDDEFNGTSLDTAKWSTGWLGSGITGPVNDNEKECYDPAQVSVGGGSLNLQLIAKIESCGSNDPRFTSGLVNTDGKFSYTYGLLEARVWLPAANENPGRVANWPGVWTDGQNWPYDGEDDVAEGLGGRVCTHFHSAVDSRGLAPGGGNGCADGSYAGGWHTFAADWEPGIVTYYYDGTNVGSVTTGVTSAPMFIVLSYAAGQAYLQAPDTMKVDYVRVWQHP
jgi:beta-glucanase (GH16 family)